MDRKDAHDWNGLTEIGLPAVKPLIDYLRGKLYDDDERAIMSVLSDIGKPVVEDLITELNSSKSHSRYSAATILGKIRDKRAVKPLIKAMEENPRHAPFPNALSEIGDESAIEPLIFAMKNGCSHATRVLGNWDGKWKPIECLDEFIEALEYSEYSETRSRAAYACGEIGSKEAVEPLLKVLKDDEQMFVCAAVARALGKIGDPRAIKPIQNALINKNFVSTEDLHKGDTKNPATTAYEEALKKLS